MRVTLEIPPPPSRNAGGSSSRGAKHARHRRKKADEADIRTLLLAHGVPCPIPGDRVHATAVVKFPVDRGRDEGNYRDSLEKALGDALCPHQSKEERELGVEPLHKFLTDDTPAQFTFGAVTFGLTELREWRTRDGKVKRRRAPAVAEVTLLWGDDLPIDLGRPADLDLLLNAMLLVGDSVGVARARGMLRGDVETHLQALDTPELRTLVESWADAGVDIRAAIERYVSRAIHRERLGDDFRRMSGELEAGDA